LITVVAHLVAFSALLKVGAANVVPAARRDAVVTASVCVALVPVVTGFAVVDFAVSAQLTLAACVAAVAFDSVTVVALLAFIDLTIAAALKATSHITAVTHL
jgi:hypothetical protein